MTKFNYLSIKTFHGNEFGVCALCFCSVHNFDRVVDKVDSNRMRKVIAVDVVVAFVAVLQCFLSHFNGIFSLVGFFPLHFMHV